MDLQADIKWIKNELNDVKDPTLVEAFKNLLKYRLKTKTVAYTVEGTPLTKEAYKQELLNAEAEIKRKEYTTQEDLERESENW